jgi:hypothetical protein
MMKTRAAVSLGFVLALAACADSSRSVSLTGPDASPSHDVTELAAALGGRASGRAEILRILPVPPFPPGGESRERYSFIDISVDPTLLTPFAAKGEFQGDNSVEFNGVPGGGTSLHADIDCLRIVDNVAFISGPVKRYTINGEPQPVAGLQVFVQVQDNGETDSSMPDLASPMLVGALPPRPCAFFAFPMLPSIDGNIQVSQR